MIDALSWEVLNATADDWESLDQLHSAVCRFDASVGREEVAGVVARLLSDGLLEQQEANAPVAEGWFRMTVAGRAAWEQATDRYVRPA
jgi:hypothetical protein